MIALLPAILASSLLGSVHCVAMCGPLIGLTGARSFRLALIHSLGRLTTYAVLGALAGLVGHALDLAGKLANVQRAAAVLAAVVIVAVAIHSLVGTRVKPLSAGLFRRGLVQIRARRPATREWLVGVLTGLLPCGWLWAFVVSAAGTGGPVRGAVLMAVFWLGTLPAMVGLLTFAGPVLAHLRKRLPIVTAAVLIALGLGTLAMRWQDAGVTQTHCHCEAPS